MQLQFITFWKLENARFLHVKSLSPDLEPNKVVYFSDNLYLNSNLALFSKQTLLNWTNSFSFSIKFSQKNPFSNDKDVEVLKMIINFFLLHFSFQFKFYLELSIRRIFNETKKLNFDWNLYFTNKQCFSFFPGCRSR